MGPSCYMEFRGIRNRTIRGLYCICENSFDIKKTPYHTVYYITLSVTMTEYRWEYELAKDTPYFCSHVNYGVSLVSILQKNNHVINRFNSIDGSAQDSSNSIANTLELPQYCAKPFIWCNNILIQFSPGPWFNIKMTSYQYRKSHCGDETILRPSYLLGFLISGSWCLTVPSVESVSLHY